MNSLVWKLLLIQRWYFRKGFFIKRWVFSVGTGHKIDRTSDTSRKPVSMLHWMVSVLVIYMFISCIIILIILIFNIIKIFIKIFWLYLEVFLENYKSLSYYAIVVSYLCFFVYVYLCKLLFSLVFLTIVISIKLLKNI